MEALGELGDSATFTYGLLAGCIVVALGALSALFDRKVRRPGIVGVGIAVATVAAVRFEFGTEAIGSPVLGAFVAFAIAGYVVSRFELRFWSALGVHIPAGIALVWATSGIAIGERTVEVPTQIRIAAGVLAVFAALCITDFDRAHERLGLGVPLFVIATLGLFLCAPDTEVSAALFGAGLPALACVWPRPVVRLTGAGASAAAACFAWVAAVESVGRTGAFIGAAGALGFLLYEPIGRRIPRGPRLRVGKHRHRDRDRSESRIVLSLTAILAQLIVSWYGSRIAGLEAGVLMALLVLLPAVAFGLFAAPEVLPIRNRRPHRRRRRSSAGSGRSGRSRRSRRSGRGHRSRRSSGSHSSHRRVNPR